MKRTILSIFVVILLGTALPFSFFLSYFVPFVGLWPFLANMLALIAVCSFGIRRLKFAALLYVGACIFSISICFIYIKMLYSAPNWMEQDWLCELLGTYFGDADRVVVAVPFVLAFYTLGGASLLPVMKFIDSWRLEKRHVRDSEASFS